MAELHSPSTRLLRLARVASPVPRRECQGGPVGSQQLLASGVSEHEHEEDDASCINCGLDYDFDLPSTFVDAAHRGNLVVFAGAGVSTEVPAVFPTTFYDEIRARISREESTSFPEVMGAFEAEFGRQELLRSLKHRLNYVDSFPSLRRQARKFHRELATMPYLRDIITTNWDTYFEEECLATPFTSGGDFTFHEMPGRRVYKIHGSISTLSTLVLTEADYSRRLDELRENVLGGALRQILATKTVVFIGYSLRDWNFRRLYDALRADMGTLAPRAYFVSPFASTDADELGLTWLRTSGAKFLSTLKSALVRDSHFLPDDRYERVLDLEDLVLDAKEIVSKYSHKDQPTIAHCWAYQEGMLDACGRIALRRGSGEYSDSSHIVGLAEKYDAMIERSLGRNRYFHAAYLDGYINALVVMLSEEDDEALDHVPLFSVYGSDSAMRTEEDLQKALVQSRKRAPKARAEAKKISSRLPADMVMTHGPFLPRGAEVDD